MFEFTFFEYNLIILATSFFVFSFEIKSQAYKKFFEFSELLETLRNIINKTIGKKAPNILKEQKSDLLELVDSKEDIFKYCLSKVSVYVYHSFYLIFLLSGLGIILSSINELNILNLNVLYGLQWFKLIIHLLAVILFYWVLRAIFCLICYTKIDYDYIERLFLHIENKIYYNVGKIEETPFTLKKLWKMMQVIFRITLFKFFFFGFIIFDKKFKKFFYTYYNI